MTAGEVSASVHVGAPPQAVWDALVQWDRQRSWMLWTTVQATRAGGHGVGAEVKARSGFGPFRVTDPMVITRWDPPSCCEVMHCGPLVRGEGAFELEPLSGGRTQLTWWERLDLPGGRLGSLGWPLVRPAFEAAVRVSLRRLGRIAESSVR